jgi:hypothetical protein
MRTLLLIAALAVRDALVGERSSPSGSKTNNASDSR